MVETTEDATMNMMQLKYVPSRGTASDVAGIVSATMLRNTVNDSNIVTPGYYRTQYIINGFEKSRGEAI